MQILGAISHVIRVSEPKTEKPIESSNRSGLKTNCRKRIKFSNLEAPKNAVLTPTFKLFEFRRYFICVYVFLFFFFRLKTFFICIKILKPPKLERNLEI